MIRWLLIGAALLLVAGVGAHAALLWMDRRGWIFYRTKAPSGTLSRAVMELEVFHHPEIEHVIEGQLEVGVEERESGEPEPGAGVPEPGAREPGGPADR